MIISHSIRQQDGSITGTTAYRTLYGKEVRGRLEGTISKDGEIGLTLTLTTEGKVEVDELKVRLQPDGNTIRGIIGQVGWGLSGYGIKLTRML